MKSLFVLICLVFTLVLSSTALAGGADVMIWNPRTPAGGAYTDPNFFLNEAVIARYGDRAINLRANPITNQYISAGSAFFSGTTNYVSTDSIGSQAIIGTDFNAQTGTMSIGVGK